MNCKHCNKETSNPKFCSMSCAASYNNKHGAPKRKKAMKECFTCKTLIPIKNKYCPPCREPKDPTLKQAGYYGDKYHRSNAYTRVRERARAACKHLEKVCSSCGYNKHVQVCHIKPISEYPPETYLSEINKLTNLLLLCPNCHWEFDHLK